MGGGFFVKFDVNSPVLFALVGVLIAAVLAQSVYFLVRALRRGQGSLALHPPR